MKHIALLLIVLLTNINVYSQNLYSKAYGDPLHPSIVYIHGGPRGNSTLFEGTTAKTLASKGYHVIVYDRRGEGRSVDTAANFSFKEAMADINEILAHYNLTNATFLGHSFGGILATLFTSENPEKVNRLILIGALFSQQETYNHILKSVEKHANNNNEQSTIDRISEINRLDTLSAQYRKACYELASAYGYFKMPNPTKQSIRLRIAYEKGIYGQANIRNDNAPLRFYQNEKMVNINTKDILKKSIKNGNKIFGIYGKDDGLFSQKQISDLRAIVGADNLKLIDNCSHYPFVDQQEVFIQHVMSIMSR